MKKLLLSAMLLLSATLINTPVKKVFADDTSINTEVINVVENQHQINMGEFTKFAVTDNMAYYLDDSLHMVDFNNNFYQSLTYSNVTNIKQTDNYVVIKSNNYLKVLKNNNEIKIPELTAVECLEYNVFEKNNTLYIAYTLNNNNVKFISISNGQVIEKHKLKTDSNKVVNICLSDEYTYILTTTVDNNYRMTKYDNSLESATTLTFSYLDVNNIELHNTLERQYLLVVNNNNSQLHIIKEQENSFLEVAYKNTLAPVNPSFKLGEVRKISDVKSYKGLIYIGDNINNSIQSFKIEKTETNYTLTPVNIVVARNCYEKGYFNNIHDFYYINDNNILVSDTDNNRIQMINDEIKVIDTINNVKLNKPKFLTTADNSTYWLYSNNKIIKIYNDTSSELPTNSITDLKVDGNNDIYYLDLVDESLKTIKNGTVNSEVIKSGLNLNNDSKLLLLNNNTIAVSTNKEITLYNISDGEQLTKLTLEDNIKSIDKDFYNNIYVLTNRSIIKLNNTNNTLTLTTPLNYDASKLNYIHIDCINGNIIAYDYHNSRLLKIKSSYVNTIKDYTHIIDTNNYQVKDKIIDYGTINTNSYITLYPYNTGIITLLNQDTKVIILGEIDNNYYIMYNKDNIINYGYINKSYVNKINYSINEVKTMLVINKNIKLYKLPTILKDINNNNFNYSTVPLNTILNIVNSSLLSIDNSQYYAVKTEDNKILYVNASDVTDDNTSDIMPLPDTNAEIISVGNNKVKLYRDEDNQSSVLLELNQKQKMFVENYDSKKQYTYVTIITKDKTTISGYVETKYVKLTTNNPFMTSAYILLGISIVIAITSVIVFVKSNKKDVIS